jgi:predicted DNA binding protein
MDRRTREVVLLVRHHGEPESDVSAEHPGVTLHSCSSMTGREGRRKRIVELAGGTDDIDAFLDEFAAAAPVIDAEPLTELGRSRVYVAATLDAAQWDSIADRLSELGVHYRNGTTISAGWERWTLYLGLEEATREVRAALETDGNETELVRDARRGAVDRLDGPGLRERLTDRQREALRLAIDRGFYGPDGSVPHAELADELGVAKTTAWEHLKRAEAMVMDELVGVLRERPDGGGRR